EDWLQVGQRYAAGAAAALADRSRRPRHSPLRYDAPVMAEVVALHRQWGWGGRKIRRRLLDLGRTVVPAASTCTSILHRAGAFAERAEPPAGPLQRFVRAQPNELW